MISPVRKRSVVINGHKTSVSLEEAFLEGLKEIATAKEVSFTELLSIIDRGRNGENLSSWLRLYVLAYYQTRAGPPSAEISDAELVLKSAGS